MLIYVMLPSQKSYHSYKIAHSSGEFLPHLARNEVMIHMTSPHDLSDLNDLGMLFLQV